MNLLNLGCGNRYLKNWVNLDYVKTGDSVLAHDLKKGIPYPDNTFDVVYHSHVLEHFTKNSAEFFIQECYRVLKPDGVLRVVVPDLEKIVIEYLKNLNNAMSGINGADEDYNWIMLELYDQTVRNKTGGEMLKYWQQDEIKNISYIKKRIGQEFNDFLDRKSSKTGETNRNWKHYLNLSYIYQKTVSLLFGKTKYYKYIKLSQFRLGGEVHYWMYDRYSLSRLLKEKGFVDIKVADPMESSIPNWESNSWLDRDRDRIRKPDSLFMEANK